jgi:hypothetical protein
MVREQPLIDRTYRWLQRFDPVEKTFGDFRQGLEHDNAAFFALLRSDEASTYLEECWEFLFYEANRACYWLENQIVYDEEGEELELTEDWYILAQDRERLGNERILPDPNQLPLF